MKELTNKLLHAIEDLSGRLSQLESKMYYLENSMNDLKVCNEYNHGKTDGKLKQLENIVLGVPFHRINLLSLYGFIVLKM